MRLCPDLQALALFKQHAPQMELPLAAHCSYAAAMLLALCTQHAQQLQRGGAGVGGQAWRGQAAASPALPLPACWADLSSEQLQQLRKDSESVMVEVTKRGVQVGCREGGCKISASLSLLCRWLTKNSVKQ